MALSTLGLDFLSYIFMNAAGACEVMRSARARRQKCNFSIYALESQRINVNFYTYPSGSYIYSIFQPGFFFYFYICDE